MIISFSRMTMLDGVSEDVVHINVLYNEISPVHILGKKNSINIYTIIRFEMLIQT
jgi:hypothetical protein